MNENFDRIDKLLKDLESLLDASDGVEERYAAKLKAENRGADTDGADTGVEVAVIASAEDGSGACAAEADGEAAEVLACEETAEAQTETEMPTDPADETDAQGQSSAEEEPVEALELASLTEGEDVQEEPAGEADSKQMPDEEEALDTADESTDLKIQELEDILDYEKTQEKQKRKRLIGLAIAAILLIFIGIGRSKWTAANPLVPNIIGCDSVFAENKLKETGFVPVVKKDYSDEVAAGIVISQEGPESRKPLDSEVVYVVSQGRKPEPIKNMIGKTLSEAKELLLTSGLSPDVEEAYDEKVEKGLVISQNPAEGTEVGPDTRMKLVISKGSAKVKPGDLVGLTEAEASEKLQGLGVKASFSEGYSDKIPAGQVMKQSFKKDEAVLRDSTVELVLSKGVKLIKVADLTALTPDEAKAALEKEGLKVEISREFSDTVEKDLLVSQSNIGEELKSGATVKLVVSDGKAPEVTKPLPKNMVKVPNVKGMSYQNAAKVLAKAGLTYSYSTVKGNIGYHKVLRQGIEAGKVVKRNTKVKLYLSSK